MNLKDYPHAGVSKKGTGPRVKRQVCIGLAPVNIQVRQMMLNRTIRALVKHYLGSMYDRLSEQELNKAIDKEIKELKKRRII